MRKLRLAAVGIASALALTAIPGQSAAVDEINTKRLRKAVTTGGILGHERVLQRIANNNEGTRASGTPGYAASARYVKRTLTRAGYNVSEQEFTFPPRTEAQQARRTTSATTRLATRSTT